MLPPTCLPTASGLALNGALCVAAPKRLRLRIFGVAGRLV
jgi:hypothetical protein